MYAVELRFAGEEAAALDAAAVHRELGRAAETIGFPVEHITRSGPLVAVVFLTAAGPAEALTIAHQLSVVVLAYVPQLRTYRHAIWPTTGPR